MYNMDLVFNGFSDIRYRTAKPGQVKRTKRLTGAGSGSRNHNDENTTKELSEDQVIKAKITESIAAWGYVFQINTETVPVGSNVTFSNNGPLNGINHTPGSAGIDLTMAGTYNITFSVYTSQNNPQDWGIVVNGTVRARFNSAGQTMTGTASFTLEAGDRITIRNVNTIPDPANLRTGDFTTAYVLLYKVD